MKKPAAKSCVKVLIADDSAFMRSALSRMIESDESLRVVGTAQTGGEAIQQILELQPDVMTLDIHMPGMDGLQTLKRVMAETPLPVIMVSSLTQDGAEVTVEALGLGAFDCVSKGLNYLALDVVRVRDELVGKIKAAAQSGRRRRARAEAHVAPARVTPPRGVVPAEPPSADIVAIGTSTGGPKALLDVLPVLPKDLPVAVLVVQHMPMGFTGPFAHRLNGLCQVVVHEAEPGMRIEPGHVYLAGAGKHMTVRRVGGETFLQTPAEPDMLHVPSVDVMMVSVAEAFQARAVGIILTGMGADGALGMQAIYRAGGLTIGQDEATCAVYGMPRTCAEMKVLKRVVGLQEVPRQILQAVGYLVR